MRNRDFPTEDYSDNEEKAEIDKDGDYKEKLVIKKDDDRED